ncbi:MAG: DNA repair putative endonuclease MmcB [Hyphomicrobiales bacterium]|nr:DNA repair putative endonuclease MmcB [Hyphomicrobiales bacterium]MBV9053607.1 DNA repair putative endonuclease MmcB [Hyphomicrobiales bacterium]
MEQASEQSPVSVATSLSRPEVTLAVTRGAMRCLRALGYSVLSEVVLASGRRADILALAPHGRILIIEVKSGFEDWRADSKWSDYAAYCDALAFAVAPDFPADVLPADLGLIVADAYGGAVIREPIETPLQPARRRAMLMRFAALAADRLQNLVDPITDEMLR